MSTLSPTPSPFVLLTTRGLVHVTVSPLCGALVLVTGRAQHERWHVAR